ncbi:hypothetical protein BCL57_002214 [Agromyces flavus]|uniref:Uncharacterized protein n=2 Tax=Agromyces flavus TaxID=589382 RepID=A0ABT1KNF2_9MICO|nr:hypothetical protein [Agromyces flavus]MCP2368055.1 hypothetical protein [Agromyces flavus]
MSVVIAAATRWREGVAFLRASALRARDFAADADGVRADFAASPRAAAADDDAAREAVLRLEAGRDSAAPASMPSGTVASVVSAAALDAAACDRREPDFLADGFFGSDCDVDVADAEADADLAGFEPVEPASVDVVPVDLVFAGFDGVRGDRARGARSPDERAAAGASASPRSEGTPVPVPSGVSSSGRDGETEVTRTTYQPARAGRWRTP